MTDIEEQEELLSFEDNPPEEVDYYSEIYNNLDHPRSSLEMAKKQIAYYFHDLEMYCGGTISQSISCTDEYASACLNTPVGIAAEQAHVLLESNGHSAGQDGLLSDNTLLIIRILNSVARKKIPQHMVGGLLLMHLEWVEGVGR